jgi:hypothetical protein
LVLPAIAFGHAGASLAGLTSTSHRTSENVRYERLIAVVT